MTTEHSPLATNHMRAYVLRRLLVALSTVLGVATATFAVLYLLPGDPVQGMLVQSGASGATIAQVRAQLGLGEPLPVQYGRFLLNLAQGNLGRSLVSQRPVTDMIGEQLPATLQLALAALLVTVVVGIGLGTLAALHRGTWADRLCMLLSVVGVSLPQFWLGLLLIMVVAFQLQLLPATGTAGLERLIMPALVLGLGSAAAIARLVRASLAETLTHDFVRTARAKGLTERLVVQRHAVRHGFIPVLAYLGVQLGWLLAGTIVTETVFSRRGIGRLLVGAIEAKDFPVVQGVVLFIALAAVSLNLVVDLAYALIDPRVRES